MGAAKWALRASSPRAPIQDVEATVELPDGTDGPRGFAWGFVSQGLSSATNLALSLIAARVLGPGGLGSVAIGFASYLVILGLERALVTDPLVAFSAGAPSDVRRRSMDDALTVALVGTAASAGVMALVGVGVRGDIGRALFVLAPWIPLLVVQDFWRAVLFRDGRARAAAVNDGCWLVAMGLAAPFAWWLGSLWAVVGCWGFGGLAGTLLGFGQTRAKPASIGLAVRWWKDTLWPLGRWFGATSLGYSVLTYATILALAGLIGAEDLGGLRAVMTIFAPLTLIGAALALPGLPAITRAVGVSAHQGVRLAFRVGAASTLVTAAYFGLLSIGGGAVVALVFGDSFQGFSHLVWPIGIGQVVAAISIGFALLLKAERRGKAVLVANIVSPAVGLVLGCGLAAVYGVTGAAWGIFGSCVAGTVVTTVLALAQPAERRRPATARPQHSLETPRQRSWRGLSNYPVRLRPLLLGKRGAARALDVLRLRSPWVKHRRRPAHIRPLDEFKLFAIVGTWMEADVIEATVRNAFTQGCDRVFLVDNESPDGTVDVALGAGAELAASFPTDRYDEHRRLQVMNDAVARISADDGSDHIWWLWLDADEFPHGPSGSTVRGYLATLDCAFRIVGARCINHYPGEDPHYVSGRHPLDFQPLGEELMSRYSCWLWHWKHPLQRFDRGRPPIECAVGFHRASSDERPLFEPVEPVFLHHFPFRDRDVTERRLRALFAAASDEPARAELDGFAAWHMSARLRSLEAVYAQDWGAVEMGVTEGTRRPQPEPVPWTELVESEHAHVARWYRLDSPVPGRLEPLESRVG